jgi:hypothetical protein
MRLAAAALVLALVAAPRPSDAAPDAAPPVVKLVSAGKAPRRTLRFHPKAGQTYSPTMRMKMTMKMALGGGSANEVSLPPMRLRMSGKVLEVDAAGAARVTTTMEALDVVEEPGADKAMIATLRGQLDLMKGARLGFKIDPRGIVTEPTSELPPTMPPQMVQMMGSMQQSIGQIVAPFPVEAVGVGARWTVDTKVAVNGMAITQTATYVLEALAGDRGTAKVTLVQRAAAQDVKAPGMPAGATVHLESLSSSGRGSLAFDLGDLLPARCTMVMTSATKMLIEMGGSKTPMTMDLTMDMALPGR